MIPVFARMHGYRCLRTARRGRGGIRQVPRLRWDPRGQL